MNHQPKSGSSGHPADSAAAASLRMKIKRKKMGTRQSGPCHEVQRVTPGSGGPSTIVTTTPSQKSSAKNSFSATGSSENSNNSSNSTNSVNCRHQNGTTSKNGPLGSCTNSSNNGTHKSHQVNVTNGINNHSNPSSIQSKSNADLSANSCKKILAADDINSVNHSHMDADSIGEEKLERRDVGTWVRTVGGGTDAECFGPCEPGTAVTLEGIVWHETAAGILVVNVTWRGKSYVGTLLDCTKSEWAAPRFCESPNSDLDGSKTATKGRNVKRSAANNNNSSSSSYNNNNNGGSSSSNNNNNNNSRSGTESATNKGQNNKSQQHQDGPAVSGNGELALQSPAVEKPDGPKFEAILEPLSPLLFECPLDGCEKKYGQLVALKYHQNSSHRNKIQKERVKDASTMTIPMIIESAEQTEAGPSKGQPRPQPQPQLPDSIPPNVVGIHQDLSPNSKKQLSEAENESLENLFKVVPQIPCSSSSTGPPSAPPTASAPRPPVVQSPKGHKGAGHGKSSSNHVSRPNKARPIGTKNNHATTNPATEGQSTLAPSGATTTATLAAPPSKTPPLQAMPKTPPVLQIDDRRPSSRNSNNYSDVSDPEDEAPTLERHNSPLVAPGLQGPPTAPGLQGTTAPVAQQQAPVPGAVSISPVVQVPPPAEPPMASSGASGGGSRFQQPSTAPQSTVVGPSSSSSSTSAIVSDLKQPQNTGKIMNELSVQTNLKKTPMQPLKTLPIKPEPTNSPQTSYLPLDRPQPPSAMLQPPPGLAAPPAAFPFPYSFAGGPGPPTIIPNPGPLMYHEPNPGQLVYGGGPMFAFPIGSAAPMNHHQSAAALLTSPGAQASYFAVPVAPPPPPHQPIISQSPTCMSGGSVGGVLNSTNQQQHKIHELSSDSMMRPSSAAMCGVSSAPSPGAGRRSTDDKKSMMTSSDSSNVIVQSTKGGRLDEPMHKDQSSRSPPVQRHTHLHHHTHSYPFLAAPSPYTAMLASQQAAAASVVGAFPPFARKQ